MSAQGRAITRQKKVKEATQFTKPTFAYSQVYFSSPL